MKPTQEQIQMADHIARENAAFSQMVDRITDRLFALALAAVAAWLIIAYLTPCAEGSLC